MNKKQLVILYFYSLLPFHATQNNFPLFRGARRSADRSCQTFNLCGRTIPWTDCISSYHKLQTTDYENRIFVPRTHTYTPGYWNQNLAWNSSFHSGKHISLAYLLQAFCQRLYTSEKNAFIQPSRTAPRNEHNTHVLDDMWPNPQRWGHFLPVQLHQAFPAVFWRWFSPCVWLVDTQLCANWAALELPPGRNPAGIYQSWNLTEKCFNTRHKCPVGPVPSLQKGNAKDLCLEVILFVTFSCWSRVSRQKKKKKKKAETRGILPTSTPRQRKGRVCFLSCDNTQPIMWGGGVQGRGVPGSRRSRCGVGGPRQQQGGR